MTVSRAHYWCLEGRTAAAPSTTTQSSAQWRFLLISDGSGRKCQQDFFFFNSTPSGGGSASPTTSETCAMSAVCVLLTVVFVRDCVSDIQIFLHNVFCSSEFVFFKSLHTFTPAGNLLQMECWAVFQLCITNV